MILNDLPNDILKIILIHFGGGMYILYRHVCNHWRVSVSTFVESTTTLASQQQSSLSEPIKRKVMSLQTPQHAFQKYIARQKRQRRRQEQTNTMVDNHSFKFTSGWMVGQPRPQQQTLVQMAKQGRIEVVKWIYQLRQRQWPSVAYVNRLLRAAAKSGNAALVRLCVELYGATDMCGPVWYAAYYGHDSIVRLCHDDLGMRTTDAVEYAVVYAALGGHQSLVELCLDKYHSLLMCNATEAAALAGHASLLEFMLGSQSDIPAHRELVYAAMGGQDHIVRLLFARYHYTARMANAALVEAARHGHVTTFRLLKDVYNATDVLESLRSAAGSGDIDVVRICIEEYWPSDTQLVALKVILSAAAASGQLHLICTWWPRYVDQCVQKQQSAMVTTAHESSATLCRFIDAPFIVKMATEGGFYTVLQWYRETVGSINADKGMVRAAKYDHIDLVRFCYEQWGAQSCDATMECAARYGHLEIIQLCHDEYGVTNLDATMSEAARCKQWDVVQWCLDQSETPHIASVVYWAAHHRSLHMLEVCYRLNNHVILPTDLEYTLDEYLNTCLKHNHYPYDYIYQFLKKWYLSKTCVHKCLLAN